MSSHLDLNILNQKPSSTHTVCQHGNPRQQTQFCIAVGILAALFAPFPLTKGPSKNSGFAPVSLTVFPRFPN